MPRSVVGNRTSPGRDCLCGVVFLCVHRRYVPEGRRKNEKPFIILLDSVEDPHNLGAIIRTANVCGAHGVIIPKNRSARLTATVARTSAGALSHTPVAHVTNLTDTIEQLKEKGFWFVCADMDGKPMYDLEYEIVRQRFR